MAQIRADRLSDLVGGSNRLNGIFPKDYHFLAIRESNRAGLYITGIPDPRRGSLRPRQDLPVRSFVRVLRSRSQKDERSGGEASSRRPRALEERRSRGSRPDPPGPIINLPNRISSASGRLEKVDTSFCPIRSRSLFHSFSRTVPSPSTAIWGLL